MEHNAEISENTQQESVPVMKRTIKDSVFTNLFKDKKYLKTALTHSSYANENKKAGPRLGVSG